MDQLADMHMHEGFAPDPVVLAASLAADDILCFANTVTPEECSRLARDLEGQQGVRIGLGLHPWWIAQEDEGRNARMLESFLDALPSFSFVGEIGLDFSPRHSATDAQQISCFDEIVAACAKREGMLLSVHAIKAEARALDIIERHHLTRRNALILHSYAGSSESLTRAIEMGAFFSIGSRMLRTKRGREYARVIPTDRLLVESDLPSFSGDEVEAQDIRRDLESTLNDLAIIREVDQRELDDQIIERSRELLGFQARR